jgi:hypothetical protein
MDIELQKYYENRFEFFSSQGWKDLVEDLEKMKQAVSDISNYSTAEAFWTAKGELRMISWLLNLEQLSEEAYTQLKEE